MSCRFLELVPRIYLETAFLKCYRFLNEPEQSYTSILERLTLSIRGIADPLVAAYTRAFLVRMTEQCNEFSNKTLTAKYNCFICSPWIPQPRSPSSRRQAELRRVSEPLQVPARHDTHYSRLNQPSPDPRAGGPRCASLTRTGVAFANEASKEPSRLQSDRLPKPLLSLHTVASARTTVWIGN